MGDPQILPECETRFGILEESLKKINTATSVIKKVLKEYGIILHSIDVKVNNGLGDSLEDLEKRVDRFENHNSRSHRELRNLIFTALILIVVGFVGSNVYQNRTVKVNNTRVIEEVRDEVSSQITP